MKENNRQRFIIMISLVVAVVSTLAVTPVSAGPVVLLGIDAEDGGVGGHGPIANYVSVVNSTLANVTNGGSNILVIGGNKSTTDQVTAFWNAIDASIPAHSVVYVNGATDIATQPFAGFAMIAVVSSVSQTPSGGLTQAENDALAGRQADIAAFVNGGGGLLGLSQIGLTNPYAYIAGVGAFTFNFPSQYSNIDPTPEGLAIGITDALDVCCWHDEYITFPSFLQVLATNNATGNASAIGGQQVIIQPTELEGRMTGGGSVFNDSMRVTHGFTLSSNISDKSNNLQVNWGKGNKFHLENLTSATLSDDPAITPNPPNASFDTYEDTGTGSYNGIPGSAHWIFTDAGEPGKYDTALIQVWDNPAMLGTPALSVSGNLTNGNQQAHAE